MSESSAPTRTQVPARACTSWLVGIARCVHARVRRAYVSMS